MTKLINEISDALVKSALQKRQRNAERAQDVISRPHSYTAAQREKNAAAETEAETKRAGAYKAAGKRLDRKARLGEEQITKIEGSNNMRKQKLKEMLEAMINEQDSEARAIFHDIITNQFRKLAEDIDLNDDDSHHEDDDEFGHHEPDGDEHGEGESDHDGDEGEDDEHEGHIFHSFDDEGEDDGDHHEPDGDEHGEGESDHDGDEDDEFGHEDGGEDDEFGHDGEYSDDEDEDQDFPHHTKSVGNNEIDDAD